MPAPSFPGRRDALRTIVASIASIYGGSAPAFAQNRPLKVGVLAPKSGVAAYIGSNGLRAMEWTVKKINEAGGIAGRQVEVVVDEETTPKETLDRARRMVLQEKVDCVQGIFSSGVSLAMAPALEEMKTVTLFWDGTTQDGVKETILKPNFVFRSTDNECEAVLAALLIAQNWKGKFKRIAAVSPDYTYGRNVWTALKALLGKLGIETEVVAEHWTKLGTLDFNSTVAALKAAKPDLVFCVLGTVDLPVFMRTAHGAGLGETTRFALLQAGHMWGQLKKNFIPEGTLMCANTFYFDLPNPSPIQKEFVQYYMDRYKDIPHWECDRAYFAMQAYKLGVERAVKAKNGSWPSSEEVARSIEGLRFESLGGPAMMRTDHIPEQTFHQGFSTNKNQFEVPTLASITSVFSSPGLQKPMGADFWKWLASDAPALPR